MSASLIAFDRGWNHVFLGSEVSAVFIGAEDPLPAPRSEVFRLFPELKLALIAIDICLKPHEAVIFT